MEFKIIDALLDADKRLIEGWSELKSLGSNDTYYHLSLYMNIDSMPTILNVFNVVKESSMSTNDKWYALEGITENLGLVALKLGFIDKYRVTNKPCFGNIIAMGFTK